MKPFYHNELVTLYHGDCIAVMGALDRTFQCLFTDPPYFVLPKGKADDGFTWDSFKDYDEFAGFTRDWHKAALRLLDGHSCEFIFWSQKYLNDGVALFKPSRLCFWHHSNLINVGGMNDFAFDYEPLFVNWNGAPMLKKEGRKSCFLDYVKPQSNFKGDQKLVHPTQKPVALVADIVGMLDGVESVIDPFAGSGTTGLACMRRGVKCVLIERDAGYCAKIVQRLEEAQQTELF